MKRYWPLIVILQIGILAYMLIEQPFTPESAKIQRQIRNYLDDAERNTLSHPFWKIELRDMRHNMAKAYLRENRPDDTIEIIAEILREHRQPRKNIYGQVRSRRSVDYLIESQCYDTLAQAYALKNNHDGMSRSLKKSQQLQEKARQMIPAEEAGKSREKQRERDELLN
jgi:CRISPR/Cas system-associated endonuclease Cas1